jgi:hypothetical protein
MDERTDAYLSVHVHPGYNAEQLVAAWATALRTLRTKQWIENYEGLDTYDPNRLISTGHIAELLRGADNLLVPVETIQRIFDGVPTRKTPLDLSGLPFDRTVIGFGMPIPVADGDPRTQTHRGWYDAPMIAVDRRRDGQVVVYAFLRPVDDPAAAYGAALGSGVISSYVLREGRSADVVDEWAGEGTFADLLHHLAAFLATPAATFDRVRTITPAARAARKPTRSDGTVRVINLRRPEAAPSEREPPGADHPKRELSHQFLVRGFWRNQAYGTGRKLRRRIWVEEFVKGPEGAPFITTPKVYKANVTEETES